MKKHIYSIGYGNRKIDAFINLLKQYNINLLIDIRTNPVSRFQPNYNKKALGESLKAQGIDYLFMGLELGGKPKDPDLYSNGQLDYEKVKRSPIYKSGIKTLEEQIEQDHTICIMCAELKPDECHRKSLVAETLINDLIDTIHITETGSTVSHLRY